MKYLFFTALVGVIFTQNVLAKSLSVFMVEDEKSKHIALMTEDGDYKLITYGDQWHLYPNISPDGNRVVYAKGDDANSLTI